MSKRIPIDQLQPGMQVIGLDRSWWRTPFLSHKWTVRSPKDIEKLRRLGISAVDIDPARGRNVEEFDAAITGSFTIPRQGIIPPEPPEPPVVAGTLPELRFTAPKPFLTAVAEAMPAARAARDEALAILESIFEGVKIGKPIESPAIRQAVSGLLATILHRPEASLILTQLQRFETDLRTHSVDVCVLSLIIGQQQDLPHHQLEILGFGALLHDVGQTRLPRNLLRKSNVSNPYRQKLFNEHPRLGVALLSQSKDIDTEVLRILVEHHEHADGSGFPEGRKAEHLSPLSQLVGIVNLYDGLVSGHGGQAAHLPAQALRRLYQMGQAGVLVGEKVAWTIRALGVYPLGTVVELNTKERGIVVAINAKDSSKPTIHVVCDPQGRLLAEPRLVDLLAPKENEPVRTITRLLKTKAICLNLADYFADAL